MTTIQINKWCKGCRICVEMCPRHVFEVDEATFVEGAHPIVAVRPEDCSRCMQCELLCPDLAIEVVDEQT